jgi:hypothetical protein
MAKVMPRKGRKSLKGKKPMAKNAAAMNTLAQALGGSGAPQSLGQAFGP